MRISTEPEKGYLLFGYVAKGFEQNKVLDPGKEISEGSIFGSPHLGVYKFIQSPALPTITSATCLALVKGKSLGLSNLPASPAVTFTLPDWQVVSAPAGKAASSS